MNLIFTGDKAIDDAMIEVFAACERKPFFNADKTLNKNRVLHIFTHNNHLTTKQLRTLTGVVNVGQAISELRKDGWEIETELHYLPNKFGKLCKVGYYNIKKSHQDYAKECFAR